MHRYSRAAIAVAASLGVLSGPVVRHAASAAVVPQSAADQAPAAADPTVGTPASVAASVAPTPHWSSATDLPATPAATAACGSSYWLSTITSYKGEERGFVTDGCAIPHVYYAWGTATAGWRVQKVPFVGGRVSLPLDDRARNVSADATGTYVVWHAGPGIQLWKRSNAGDFTQLLTVPRVSGLGVGLVVAGGQWWLVGGEWQARTMAGGDGKLHHIAWPSPPGDVRLAAQTSLILGANGLPVMLTSWDDASRSTQVPALRYARADGTWSTPQILTAWKKDRYAYAAALLRSGSELYAVTYVEGAPKVHTLVSIKGKSVTSESIPSLAVFLWQGRPAIAQTTGSGTNRTVHVSFRTTAGAWTELPPLSVGARSFNRAVDDDGQLDLVAAGTSDPGVVPQEFRLG